MGDRLKNIRTQYSSLILTALIVQMGLIFLLWWLFTDYIVIEGNDKLAAVAFFGLFFAALISVVLRKMLADPLELIAIAIGHLEPGASVVATPEIQSLVVGNEVVEEITKRIYDLAGKQATPMDKTEEEKQQATSKLDAIFALMPAAIITIDKTGNISYYNEAASKYMDARLEKAVGQPFNEVFHLSFSGAPTLDEWLTEARANKVTDTHVWQRVKQISGDDQEFQFDMSAYFSKEESHGYEVVLAFIDHTERYQADDTQMSFVSLAVHELRTPVTVLRGYIEVFEQELGEQLDQELKSFMFKMAASASQLALFINNILNVSRIENNQLTLNRVETDWGDFLKRSVQGDFDLRAEVHNRHIKLEIPENIPTVAADPVSVYEVLSNLVDNAVKYSKDGGQIVLRVAIDSDGMVETVVQDFGIGIPQSVMAHLFEKFYRSHRSRQNVGGTGLGLYLSKTIIEAHQGHIRVQSTEGQGSVFSFTLPTYASVADSLDEPHNDGIERGSHGWIKNHSMHRR